MILPFWTKTHSLCVLFVRVGYCVPGGSVHSYWLQPLLFFKHIATAAYERKLPLTSFTVFDSIYFLKKVNFFQGQNRTIFGPLGLTLTVGLIMCSTSTSVFNIGSNVANPVSSCSSSSFPKFNLIKNILNIFLKPNFFGHAAYKCVTSPQNLHPPPSGYKPRGLCAHCAARWPGLPQTKQTRFLRLCSMPFVFSGQSCILWPGRRQLKQTIFALENIKKII